MDPPLLLSRFSQPSHTLVSTPLHNQQRTFNSAFSPSSLLNQRAQSISLQRLTDGADHGVHNKSDACSTHGRGRSAGLVPGVPGFRAAPSWILALLVEVPFVGVAFAGVYKVLELAHDTRRR